MNTESEVNYFFALKLSKIFEREDEFKMLKCLYYSYKDKIIESDFFNKKVDEMKISIIKTGNQEVGTIMHSLFKNYSKQDATNILILLSVIENAVNHENYEVANKAKQEILNVKGLTEAEYFKMFKCFVTDCPVKYDF
jgi:hypothetical protein